MLSVFGNNWEEPLENRVVVFGLTVLSIVVVVGIRVLLTPIVGDVNQITYLGVIGGLVGGLGMAGMRALLGMAGAKPTIETLQTVLGRDESDTLVGPAVVMYFTVAAVLGGLYPKVGWIAVGSATAGLPSALLVGIAYGLVVGIVVVILGLLGLFDLERELRELGTVIGAYLVFGLLVALVVAGGKTLL